MKTKLGRATLTTLVALLFNTWAAQAEISSVTFKTSRNVSFY